MFISIQKTEVVDVIIVKPEVFEDGRGFFSEVYRKDQFKELYPIVLIPGSPINDFPGWFEILRS